MQERITRRGLIAGIGAAVAGYALSKSGLYVPEEPPMLTDADLTPEEVFFPDQQVRRYWQVSAQLERAPIPEYTGYIVSRSTWSSIMFADATGSAYWTLAR
jgi:hypothetical protein